MENRARHYDDTTSKVRLITFLGFLFGFSISLVSYVGSSYYAQALISTFGPGSERYVGLFYVAGFGILLAALLNMHSILMRHGRARTLMTLLLVQVVVLLALSIMDVSLLSAVIFVLYYIIYGVIWVLWDAVLEAYSSDEETGRIRGMFLAVWGVGTIIGPSISLRIVDEYGFNMIFTVVMVLYVLTVSGVMIALRDIRGRVRRKRTPLRERIQTLIASAELRSIYWVATTLSFFYAVMVVFVPLKLHGLGFELSEMGLMFTIMLIPFMLIEYPAGVVADKWLGEKEIMTTGLLIMIIAAICISTMQHTSFVLWTSVLFFSRVGCALVESMRDAYFYKQIDGTDVALINLFRTSRSVAYILSMIMATVVQLVWGPPGVFWALVLVLLIGLYPVLTLKDTK